MKLLNQIATATGIFLELGGVPGPGSYGPPWRLAHPQVVQLVGFCISRARVGKGARFETEGF
jgi:hypothetical protein